MLGSGFQNTATADQQPFWHINALQNAAKKPAEQSNANTVKQVKSEIQASKPEWYSQVEMVDVTSVSIMPEEVQAPRSINFFGYKIDLSSKIEDLKQNYIKNYTLTKSHNLMVARFSQFKTASLGALLSMLGVSHNELENMQEKSVRVAARQNKLLFEENEYNGELLSIIGASKKRMRGQNRVLSEIRNQLLIQAKNLGLEGYYTQEKILEIRLAQCSKILEKFLEEKTNLEYQSQMMAFGVN